MINVTRSAALLFALAALAFVFVCGSAFGASPFFMFASTGDPSVFPILETYFQSSDYVSLGLATADATLGSLIDRPHQFALPASLYGVQTQAGRGCGPGTAGLIIYDPEHWKATPQNEQNDPKGSIAAGAGLVHATGCDDYGVAPDGVFMGVTPGACSYDLTASIYQQIDWTQVDFLGIQAQRLLSDACVGTLTVDDYVTFVSTIANYARAQNPAIRVAAQVSFRYTPPDRIIAAIQRTTGVVGGFYLAYPVSSSIPCTYCSPDNLAAVLQTIRPVAPPGPPPQAMFRVAIPVATATTWSQVKGVIQSGDFVWLRANSTNLAGSIDLGRQMAADVPGVHVVFFDRVGGLNSVSTMDDYLNATPLPPEIDYVGYDFEPTYQPEFTFVESVALPFFEQAATIAARHGKKVFPTPFNPFRTEAQPRPWDMGAVALRSADAMDVQLQRSLPLGLSTYQTQALQVLDDVERARTDMILFVQLSFVVSTLAELTDAALWVKSTPGFAGVFVWFAPTDASSLVDLIHAIR